MFAQVKLTFLRQFPIKIASRQEQHKIVQLVSKVLATKQRDAEADVSALERELDELVYALYGLIAEEKALVQAAAK